MRSLSRELLQRLRSTDEEKEHRDRERGNRHLCVAPLKARIQRHISETTTHSHTSMYSSTHLHSIEIKYTHRICGDQAIDTQDIEHLQRRDECASTLTNDIHTRRDE